jgi:sialate O-acetylesterase
MTKMMRVKRQSYVLMIGMTVMLASVGMKVQAEVKLPAIFCDKMVMQQQSDCHIWGTANANHTVKVKTSWDRQPYQVKTDATGKWNLTIKTPKAGGPYLMTLNDGTETQIKNIMIGEVWICSGQSNMEMPIKGFKGQPVEDALHILMNCEDDKLRLFTVKRNASLTPATDVTGQWSTASSESVREFSATAYYYGRALRQALHVPVGLIVVSWGGSACEAWMAADWLKAFPTVRLPKDDADVKKRLNRCPTALYEGMLKPIIGYAMRGVIWYQGEDNVNRYSNYADLLTTMIRGWRNDWQEGDFPFYYCQIAPYDYSLIQWHGSEYLREQQMKAESMLPNVRMAVLMDAGLEYGIHPHKKQVAGERLAMLSLASTYGMKGMPEFAVYRGVTFSNDTADVTFDHSKEWVYFNHGTKSDLFEIAGEDKVFYPAQAWISRNHVYVKSAEVKHPVAVRYAFHDWADGDLMHDGLPISSFRTDNW